MYLAIKTLPATIIILICAKPVINQRYRFKHITSKGSTKCSVSKPRNLKVPHKPKINKKKQKQNKTKQAKANELEHGSWFTDVTW